jgi:hypothetical protein
MQFPSILKCTSESLQSGMNHESKKQIQPSRCTKNAVAHDACKCRSLARSVRSGHIPEKQSNTLRSQPTFTFFPVTHVSCPSHLMLSSKMLIPIQDSPMYSLHHQYSSHSHLRPLLVSLSSTVANPRQPSNSPPP